MSHEEAETVEVTAVPGTQVEEVVCRLVGEMSPGRSGPASLDEWLVADLGYYSMLVIELAFALEDLFEIRQMSGEDVPPVGTVRDLNDYILERVRKGDATVPTVAEVDDFLRTR